MPPSGGARNRITRGRLAEHVRVLVIGGGVVGCSCLYHLAAMGWSDAILLERDDLTSGSTWHAAGNCPTFATHPSLLKLQQYSAALYRRLGDDTGYPINYHLTGSVRLAHTTERMDEYRYVAAIARLSGLDYRMLTPQELQQRYPLVQLDDLQGALWDPCDGDIDPAQLTQAFAAGARRSGARIQRFRRVTGLERRPTGDWHITTPKGEYIAEVVVNAAGYRAGEVMALLGQDLPIVIMSHQYLVTDDIPALQTRAERLPLLRDPGVSYYLRQEGGGLILGPYEQRATPAWLDGIPEDFSFRLWDDDLDRVESYIEAAYRRVPVLANAGVKRVVNGPIPYSPDGLPYLGPAHGLANFFHCNTFSFGIAQAGGAGKALAEWVTHGAPEWDLWCVHPRRFTHYATRSYALAKATETYQHEYAPAFPLEERAAGRPLRLSPLHSRLASRGARFGVRGGWERALWYDPSPPDTHAVQSESLSFRRQRGWNGIVGEEVRTVRNGIGLMDLPGFTRFLIEGPGAEAFLDRLLCSRLPRLNRIALAYALNHRGGIVSEFTLTRIAPGSFYAMSAAAAEWHDEDVLSQSLPADGSVRMRRLTESADALVLAGPRSRAVLSRITTADLSNEAFPWLSARSIDIGGARVLALRVSYAGELGWELHADNEDMPRLYEAVLEAGSAHGLRHFGLYALDSLRIDKCYRGWKSDFDSTMSPWEASLDRFVCMDKPHFIGRDALAAELERGIARRLVPMVLEAPGSADALAGSPIYLAGEPTNEQTNEQTNEAIGVVTSGTWSYTLECSVALACVRAGQAAPGTTLYIDILGERCAATVGREPLYDPENRRPRA
jgi:dimethylglycine dehydrogenase